MANISLLDCTLRDGGYVNKWNFGRDTISNICTKLAIAKVDIIEVGFLTNLPHTEDDSLYFNSLEIDAVTSGTRKSISKIAAMIAIGEMEMDPIALPLCKNCNLDIVRITFHNTDVEIKKAFRYAQCLMEKGYLVCMQPVGTTSYTNKELSSLIQRINEFKPYAFYLVDTLGVLYSKELLQFLKFIDTRLDLEIRLGFHSHNNLQMSFSNAQCICEYSSLREFIVDCSIYGMGRGAGNLCTELITQYENDRNRSRYEMTSIYEALDDYIYPIFLNMAWGYNAHYYISAVHHCHPNYASFLMNKQTITMNKVEALLKSIPLEERYIYNQKVIEKIYYDFQNNNIDDKNNYNLLKKVFYGKDVLLIAPGKTLVSYHDKIKQFIAQKHPVIVSINSYLESFHSDFIFVSNLKRLYQLDTEKLQIPVILTSNLPNIIKNRVYVGYSSLCDRNHEEVDNSGMMLIRLMEKIGLKQVYIAGYDGFSKDAKDNYFDETMINSVEPGHVKKKNDSIVRQLKKVMKNINIITLTPSKYFMD